MKKYHSFFVFFPEYSEKEILSVVGLLTENQRSTLYKCFGPDLKSLNNSNVVLNKIDYNTISNAKASVANKLKSIAKHQGSLFSSFPNYSEEQVLQAIKLLNSRFQNILIKRYGEDYKSGLFLFANFTQDEIKHINTSIKPILKNNLKKMFGEANEINEIIEEKQASDTPKHKTSLIEENKQKWAKFYELQKMKFSSYSKSEIVDATKIVMQKHGVPITNDIQILIEFANRNSGKVFSVLSCGKDSETVEKLFTKKESEKPQQLPEEPLVHKNESNKLENDELKSKLATLFSLPMFIEAGKKMDPTDYIITGLYFGYVKGISYEIDTIGKLFDMEKSEVLCRIKKTLEYYKEYLGDLITLTFEGEGRK